MRKAEREAISSIVNSNYNEYHKINKALNTLKHFVGYTDLEIVDILLRF